ncbi:MAG TPA: hypothetical protein VFC53_04105 [Dehalococcoidia bacterium]|nr:hypothetical protein [Dehalococcoidia bacterium]
MDYYAEKMGKLLVEEARRAAKKHSLVSEARRLRKPDARSGRARPQPKLWLEPPHQPLVPEPCEGCP